ncbi:MAG: DUF2436 domain-containing protein [Erysipelotrichaceae bacterium]|nr:DUF2436 domain-containing protein [Erysipelotrichaceae bacterium]
MKGNKIIALLLSALMLLTFAPANVHAQEKAAKVISGIPENVSVTVDGTPVIVNDGKVNADPGQTVTLTTNGSYKFVSLSAMIINPNHPNTALVTLTAGDVWQDGSGYQMLLDADATAFGNQIPETGPMTDSGDASADVYAVFEYKIPTNADGALSTSNIVMNDSVTIEIPAGTYDWCITNPTPGDRMWIASTGGNIGGRHDDFEFLGGGEYEFIVSLDDSTGNDQTNLGGIEITEVEAPYSYSFEMPNSDVVVTAELGYYEDVPNFWDFDDEIDVTGWGAIDNDEDGYGWMWIDATANSLEAHSGDYCMLSASYYNYTALSPDNWLISPVVKVPENDPSLSFWIKSHSSAYPDDMGVYIAPYDAETLADFTQLGSDYTAPATWTEEEIDLADYAGQYVIFAFVHHNVSDMWYLYLDDVSLNGTYDALPEIYLEIDKMTKDGITLSWNTEAEADSYELYRSDGAGWALDGTTFTDPTLDSEGNHLLMMGEEYSYIIYAYKDNALVAESKVIDVVYNPFVDVPEDSFSFPHVCWAFNNDIVGGVRASDGLDYYKLDNNCTRAQFCIMLYKMNGLPAVTINNNNLPFSDIADQTSNTKKAIVWCKNNGIVGGSTNNPTLFMPKGNIKRSQLAIMLYKMAGSPAVDVSDLHFTDIGSQTPNTRKAIVWCYQNHLIDSISGTKFSPNAQATRALLTEMLYGYNQIFGLTPNSVNTVISNTKKVNTIALGNKVGKANVRIPDANAKSLKER